jgi:beta-glucanase (GH16 family)
MQEKRVSAPVLISAFSGILLLMFSCVKGNDPGPGLTVSDVSQARGTTPSVIIFHLVLNKAAAGEVSVDYKLAEGTAKAPVDFESAPGTVKIPTGQTEGTIEVKIAGDPTDTRQSNLQFTVQLSNPRNCTLTTTSAKGIIITENGANLATDNNGYSTPLTYPGYTLVWNDEFSGKSVDLSVWNMETGNGSNGWGNNELEYYTGSPKNVFVSNGNLIIEARKETIGTFSYTSTRMTTQGKKEFKYGRIDMRAKLPVGKGIWPALWMLGSNINTVGWPACGEIDIMELIGINPSTVYGTLHWSNAGSHASKGSNIKLDSGDFSDAFHVYSLIWTKDSLHILVDDKKYFELAAAEIGVQNYPFDASEFLIFNVAVGGNWPGPPDNATPFPERMFVDYVRVFQ